MADLSRNDAGLRELALFAGAGGGILGGHLIGWRTVCAVEWEPYPACVLAQRQNDGLLPPFPIWDDVCTFDGKPWRGLVDVVSGGFPCQDISAAGKGAGIDGERSGLWREMARIIGEVRPRYVFVENSPLLVGRGLIRVLADLAEMGFDARWGVIGAADVGAPHQRDRMWIFAYSNGSGRQWADIPLPARNEDEPGLFASRCCETSSDSGRDRLEGAVHIGNGKKSHANDSWGEADRGTVEAVWEGDYPEPGILGMDDGLADWKLRIAAAGNGQVPAVAASAFRILADRLGVKP